VQLKSDREDADHQYNKNLTELDNSLLTPVNGRPSPPPPDKSRIQALNEKRTLISGHEPNFGHGWRARIRGFIWRFVGPFFQRQEEFNAILLDHIVSTNQETHTLTNTLKTLQEQVNDIRTTQSALLQYLQQITPYLNTKIYETASQNSFFLHALADGVHGISDELLLWKESTMAKEDRYDKKVSSLIAAHGELRTAIGILQTAAMVSKNQLQDTSASLSLKHSRDTKKKSVQAISHKTGEAQDSTDAARNDYKYVEFENLFRGSQDDIRKSLSEYIPYFEETSDILDIGCGRGEFLDLLRERDLTCWGIDTNAGMIAECRNRGLTVKHGDALRLIRGIPDSSLGGIFSSQVVEHLQPDYLLELLETAHQKLRPGARIILETLNPACWSAFFDSYIRDITHVQPLHPDTLKYLCIASGFQNVETRFCAPYPEYAKLRAVPTIDDTNQHQRILTSLIETIDHNSKRLNEMLFTDMNYAVIGNRP